MQSRATIIAAIRGGDSASALVEIERLLAIQPHDSDLLGLKAVALAVQGRTDDAVAAAKLAMVHAASPAQRLKHAANLAGLLGRNGRLEELASLPALGLPDLTGLGSAEFDPGTIEDLCTALILAGQQDFVSGYLSAVLDRADATWGLEHLWLKAASHAGKDDKILERFDAPGYRWRDQPEAISFASAAAHQTNRSEEAQRLFHAYLASAPHYKARKADTQMLSVVLIGPNPSMRLLSAPRIAQHLKGNFPSQIESYCGDRYRIFSVFAGSPTTSAAALIGSSGPAVTLNNCVNGEDLKRGQLAQAEAHEQALGLAVINPAAKAIHCTRVETADMLQGVPNLVVPKAMRFRLEAHLVDVLRLRISELFGYPVILRSVGEQEGANLHLATNAAELTTAIKELLALGSRDFYVIEYAGVEHEGGFFRRIRAAFVEGIPTVIRADYDDQWMVRGRKFERILDHYRRDRALFDMANAIVEEQAIGDAAWQALLEVGRRIPLDVFGMDFDVNDEGRVVFFESNATMLLLSNAPRDLDYPMSAQAAFLKRLDALFMKRAGISLH